MRSLPIYQCRSCGRMNEFGPEDVRHLGIRKREVRCVCMAVWNIPEIIWQDFATDFAPKEEEKQEPKAGKPGLTPQQWLERGTKAFDAMNKHRGNKTEAAKELGISVPTLVRWYEHYPPLPAEAV